jgi:hypothetical protein
MRLHSQRRPTRLIRWGATRHESRLFNSATDIPRAPTCRLPTADCHRLCFTRSRICPMPHSAPQLCYVLPSSARRYIIPCHARTRSGLPAPCHISIRTTPPSLSEPHHPSDVLLYVGDVAMLLGDQNYDSSRMRERRLVRRTNGQCVRPGTSKCRARRHHGMLVKPCRPCPLKWTLRRRKTWRLPASIALSRLHLSGQAPLRITRRYQTQSA